MRRQKRREKKSEIFYVFLPLRPKLPLAFSLSLKLKLKLKLNRAPTDKQQQTHDNRKQINHRSTAIAQLCSSALATSDDLHGRGSLSFVRQNSNNNSGIIHYQLLRAPDTQFAQSKLIPYCCCCCSQIQLECSGGFRCSDTQFAYSGAARMWSSLVCCQPK